MISCVDGKNTFPAAEKSACFCSRSFAPSTCPRKAGEKQAARAVPIAANISPKARAACRVVRPALRTAAPICQNASDGRKDKNRASYDPNSPTRAAMRAALSRWIP